MKPDSDKTNAREVAQKSYDRADALGWFDKLYRSAHGDPSTIPWAELAPHSKLVEWQSTSTHPTGQALVIGCGLGDDAEFLASKGWAVTAFDLSPEAIRWAQSRFPNSKVRYQVANLLNPPSDWLHKFDLIVEIYTLQAIPAEIRRQALPRIPPLLASKGLLFIFARHRESSEPDGDLPPWRLTTEEIRAVESQGLLCCQFQTLLDPQNVPRLCAIFQSP